MRDAVWQPGQDVEECAFMRGEDVAQVGAVQDVLECRKNADPDWRAVLAGDEFASVEEDQPSCYRQEGQKELAAQRDQQAENDQSRHKCLCKRPRALNDAERENTKNGEEDVLGVPDAPLVRLQTS